MSFENWRAISARIQGVSEAALLLSQFLQVVSSESHGVQKALGADCDDVLKEIMKFRTEFDSTLPLAVKARIDDFYAARSQLFANARIDAPQARAAVMLLVALRAELSFLLTDQQELIRSHTERAFLHLRRTLVVNSKERDAWLAAYNDGEVACEKLGAVHLLWHGIFAFKVDAKGGRTDLILPEPPNLNDLARAVDGLVLTEWKKADRNSAGKLYADALRQASLYSESVLSGIELARYRYLVVVTDDALPPSEIPIDVEKGGVTYRHVNIAVTPKTPSALAHQR